MTLADPAAAVAWLRRYLEHLTVYIACLDAEDAQDPFVTADSNYDGEKWTASDALHEGVRGLQTIATAADVGLAGDIGYELDERNWRALLDPLRVLIGAIDQAAEIEAIVGPQGPHLAAGSLHEWVWTSAARLWADGHRRAAVQTAATHVESQLRAKVNRDDIGEPAKLPGEAFTLEPPTADRPRLRLRGVGPDGSARWKSAHEGAMHFGMGCTKGIRNAATHQTDEIPEQEALEYLAALSVFARWVDDSVLEIAMR